MLQKTCIQKRIVSTTLDTCCFCVVITYYLKLFKIKNNFDMYLPKER